MNAIFSVTLAAWALFATAGLLSVDSAQKRAEHDHTCIVTGLKLAQTTADLARTEGDIRAQNPDEECDLACAALERHRNILMSEIRDYYKTLREHDCKPKENE